MFVYSKHTKKTNDNYTWEINKVSEDKWEDAIVMYWSLIEAMELLGSPEQKSCSADIFCTSQQ